MDHHADPDPDPGRQRPAASGGRLASLYGIADLGPANAWAVGQGKDARPLAEPWDGAAWSVMPGPTGSDPNTEVTGLSALPSGETWAAGTTFSATSASTTAFIAHHTP